MKPKSEESKKKGKNATQENCRCRENDNLEDIMYV